MQRTQRTGVSAGPLANLRLGLRVLASELRWLVQRGLRGLEIRQVRKRLEQEYLTLGQISARLAAEDADRDSLRRDQELSVAQVAFLEQELALLEAERERSRAEYVRRRVNKWDLHGEQD